MKLDRFLHTNTVRNHKICRNISVKCRCRNFTGIFMRIQKEFQQIWGPFFPLVTTEQFTGLHSRAAGPYRNLGTCLHHFFASTNPYHNQGGQIRTSSIALSPPRLLAFRRPCTPCWVIGSATLALDKVRFWLYD